ncbi:MAG TPA: NUDIX domain-containing protein [Bryobacteraceae bacterium]|nr:NUDIX domain-containing protein [Bryobacteraceae bacterium]
MWSRVTAGGSGSSRNWTAERRSTSRCRPGPRNLPRKTSAGLLLYRVRNSRIEVLLGHPGGPFWKRKDEGAWSIPKGEFSEDEDPSAAALREFEEETGFRPAGELISLGDVKQPGGKLVWAWATQGDCDASELQCNTFSLEWPPQSGRFQQFPEMDRFEWFDLDAARAKLLKAQRAFLDRLVENVPNFGN